ncbi:MAG: acyl carrier protein [Flavobacteriales bacterium]|nr:acyl carrier protein [Flavobacteriales bacterium]
MNIQEFISIIEDEFDEVETGSLSPETSFRQMEGWSSMHALILIALVDNHFDVLLTGEELRGLNTIQDLYDLLETKKA